MSKYNKAIKETKAYKEYKANKYPNGYIPKIAYWNSVINKELERGPFADMAIIAKATNKLNYFTGKEYERRKTLMA